MKQHHNKSVSMLGRIAIGQLLALLVAFLPIQKGAISAESAASDTTEVCNTDEAKKSAKFWKYTPLNAYEFGLEIQQYVERADLKSLFGLVNDELSYGPRKKSIQGKKFSEVFSKEWREAVLSEKPDCSPVGWRGFMLGHGKIWYQQDTETDEWKIFSITGARNIEAAKNPVDGSWKFNEELLTSDCFTTIWISSDNYEYHYDNFGRGKGIDFSEFISNPGRYIGGPIPIAPTGNPWSEYISLEELLLAKKLSWCSQKNDQPKITMDDGWVVKNNCKMNTPARCLENKYRLIKRIQLDQCKFLAPYLFENCIEIGLVQISEETGGSIGNMINQAIYGIIEEPITKDIYVVPLVNFGSLNEALNYVDQLAYDGQEKEIRYNTADEASTSSKYIIGEIIKFKEGLSPRSAEAVHFALKQKLLDSYSAYLNAHLPFGYPNFQPHIETELKSADIDIGIEKQIPAVFINLGLWGFCGSGGCDTSGLVKIGGTWKEVFYFFGDCTYRLLKTGKNGLRNIVAENCKSNIRSHFQFNGQKYIEVESTGCLTEERIVSLTGLLSRETHPGRPDYTSIEGGDEPEAGYYLYLSDPICIEAASYETEKTYPIVGINILQLNVSSFHLRAEIKKLHNIKSEVVVSGKPYIGITGHYHAPHGAAISVEKVLEAVK